MSIKFFIFIIVTIISLMIPENVFAKDVVQSLRATENKASEIFMTLGPIALIVSGAAFQFSKQLGATLLMGSCLGIAIFAGRHGLFDAIYGIFR